ncbi:MAG: hypothetical protein ACREJ4_14090, partial [Candidatus Methylomirabilaceae bacterium]
ISTASVYQRLRLPLTSEETGSRMRALLQSGQEEAALSCCFNRLEDVVLAAFPAIFALKQRLSSGGARPVLVSGSGPTVFGLTDGRQMARRLAADLATTGVKAIACRTLRSNPMLLSRH